jgi:hypothetical protein
MEFTHDPVISHPSSSALLQNWVGSTPLLRRFNLELTYPSLARAVLSHNVNGDQTEGARTLFIDIRYLVIFSISTPYADSWRNHPSFRQGWSKNELVANAIDCVELHAKSPVPSAAVSCENDTLPRSAWQTPICKVDTHLTFDG